MAPKAKAKGKAKAKAKAESPEKDVEMAAPAEEEPKVEEVKAEEAAEPKEEAKEEEPAPEPKKKEMDVEWSAETAADKRPKLKAGTQFTALDAQASFFVNDRYLSTIARDGFHCLLSGGRATTGIKSGRYLCEYVIADAAAPNDAQGHAWQSIRLGFGTSDAKLVPGSDANSFAVDNDSHFWSDGKGNRKGNARWNVNDVVGILLNVDASSPNANTVSVFVNGVRRFAPIPLPEALHGKALFPMVALRKAAVVFNFG